MAELYQRAATIVLGSATLDCWIAGLLDCWIAGSHAPRPVSPSA
jgi:hypothetical protein